MCVKVIGSQRWDVFWDTVYTIFWPNPIHGVEAVWLTESCRLLRHQRYYYRPIPLQWNSRKSFEHGFWAPVCKTVYPMLSDRCLSCLSVCDVGVLWPNGWMDQDATWYGGRPWPRPHYVRWRYSFHHEKGHSSPPLFSPCLLWPNGRPRQQLLSSCSNEVV